VRDGGDSVKLTNKAILIFNVKTDPVTGYEVYYPTLISGVSVFNETKTSVDKTGLLAANSYTIRIPKSANFFGKRYVAPVDYAGADPNEAFTLQPGDVIVASALVDGSGIADESVKMPGGHYFALQYLHQYASDNSLTMDEIHSVFGNVVQVLNVTDNCGAPRAQHWKVVGR